MSFLGISQDVASKIILSAAILGGSILCFFGIRLFKVVLCVAGLVIGATLAAYFAVKFTVPPEQVPPPPTHVSSTTLWPMPRRMRVVPSSMAAGGV